MEFENFTPFPVLPFVTVDRNDQDTHVVVMRGTFEIVPGKPLKLATEQGPLVLADQFHGEPARSSPKVESDLAPFKPRTDVCLVATAHAPRGRPARRWDVGLRVGGHTKVLSVTGPRRWHRRWFGGFGLTAPERATEVPITYERAFGGTLSHPKAGAEQPRVECCQSNPVGTGFCPPSMRDWLKRQREVPAPQIESPRDPIRQLGKDYRVEGFGPIGKAWLPRRTHAGTYGESWRARRWPLPPEDFNPLYWNGAHPDLVLPRLRGNEEVVLVNLTPGGRTAFTLPGHAPFVLARYEDGAMLPFEAPLDTVLLEPDAGRAVLVWRVLLPVVSRLRRIEARVTLRKQGHG